MKKVQRVRGKRQRRILNLTVGEYNRQLSPVQRGEARAIAHEMGKEYAKTVRSYQSVLRLTNPDDPLRERLTPAYIHDNALGSDSPDLFARLRSKPMSDVSWSDLQNV